MSTQTSNPAFRESVFDQFSFGEDSAHTMTVNGFMQKTVILLGAVILTAGLAWIHIRNAAEAAGVEAGYNAAIPLVIGGGIVGMIFGLITSFKVRWAPVTAPLYALAEGCFLGAISAITAMRFPQVNTVFQACCLTFGTLFLMLILYQTGVIKVTEKLRAGIIAATGAIMLLYMVSFVLSFFGITIPFIHSSGLPGIGFSLFVVGLAAFNLLLDFDLVDRLVRERTDKSMEWYAAFALMVTLVWLYIEILRLLSKLNSRD